MRYWDTWSEVSRRQVLAVTLWGLDSSTDKMNKRWSPGVVFAEGTPGTCCHLLLRLDTALRWPRPDLGAELQEFSLCSESGASNNHEDAALLGFHSAPLFLQPYLLGQSKDCSVCEFCSRKDTHVCSEEEQYLLQWNCDLLCHASCCRCSVACVVI